MKLPKSLALVCVMLAGLCSAPAAAWDGIKSGRISGVDVTDGQNFGFRVYMDGAPMCGTSEAWGYMNRDWDNYDAMAALLTSAYLSGKTVIVHTMQSGQYCQIKYVAFR